MRSTSSCTKFFDVASYCLQQTGNTGKEIVANSCNENVLNSCLFRDTSKKFEQLEVLKKSVDSFRLSDLDKVMLC